ncbi:MAG: uracil-DNA glycosylase [Vicingaceae bacterium]|jgi:uracil-DNA glycosylase
METTYLQSQVNEKWANLLSSEFESDYFKKLSNFVEEEYGNSSIFPDKRDIFSAFNYCDPDKVKVIIIGQDPYHNKQQANGLAFSVNKGIQLPPSLKNIIKELKSDVGISEPMHGDLSHWAQQGVFLLNTCLTVKAHEPLSHQNKGWELFTDVVIQKLSNRSDDLVFLLWGKKAASKAKLIVGDHSILKSHHPSPLSAYRGFLGCRHFSKTNQILNELNKTPIDWEII